MSTDLVPVADVDRELVTAEMVTNALVESRSWLAVAMKGTDPAPIAEFRAWAATVEEATRQKRLGHEIELDAAEMVRRAERGIGVAIRNGQVAGQIAKPGDVGGLPNPGGVGGSIPGHVRGHDLVRPNQFATTDQLGAGIYPVTDGVTDDEFDEAIAEAKAEANLSRANVIRKIRDEPPPKSHGRPADLANHRRLDSNRIVDQTVSTAANLDAVLSEITYADLDRNRLDEWISSLSKSITTLRRLKSNLEKELS